MSSPLRPARTAVPPAALLLIALALFGGGDRPVSGAGSSAAASESLVVLHTNDIHSRLMPFTDRDGLRVGGAAARARLIEEERGAATLVLDAGDVFQGTPFFNFFSGAPDYRSMSMMGYDAGALGNHDLDLGPEAWLRASRVHAHFPILSANVFAASESSWAAGLPEVAEHLRPRARWIGGARVPDGTSLRYLTRPYLLGEWGGRKVAILGLTTGELPRIVAVRPNGGVAVSDPITVASRIVPDLRRKVEVVIALTHLGVEEDRKLAQRVPGIDLIVGGHSHTRLERPVMVSAGRIDNDYGGTAIVQAGEWGAHVGRAALRFSGRRIHSARGRLLRVDPAEGEDDAVARMLQPYQDSVVAATARPIFESRSEVGRSGLRNGETPLGNFVADAMREAAGADLAIQNAGGIRAAIPAGTVTVGTIYEVLPFDNRLVVVPMEGWRVRELLDFVAHRIPRWGCAQVSGVAFVIRSDRATEIRVGGEPLDANRVYRVATNSFLYDGGDGYDAFRKAGAAVESDYLVRDAAVEFLVRHPDYVFKKEGRIRWEPSMKLPIGLKTR